MVLLKELVSEIMLGSVRVQVRVLVMGPTKGAMKVFAWDLMMV